MAWFGGGKKRKAETSSTDRKDVGPTDVPSEKTSQDAAAPDEASTSRADPGADGAPDASPTSATAKGRRGLFARFKQGLKRTTQVLNTDVRDLFKQEGELMDDAFLDRLYAVLIRTDMGGKPAAEIRDAIDGQFRGRVVHMHDVLAEVKEKLNELTRQPEEPLGFAASGPTVVMVVGVNGAGKTTSIAKLTAMFREQGKSVLLGAGDTFRAAAVEQLTVWADRLGAEIVKGRAESDPASVAYAAVAAAMEKQVDVCIVDTAGRLQTQSNLMEELSKIRRVMKKQIPDAPHEVLLVLDATAGQNGISQARGFSAAAECTGIVLAKLDGTAKGGVVIPIRQTFDLPVKFVGVGEQPADLAAFDSAEFVDALFEGLMGQADAGEPGGS